MNEMVGREIDELKKRNRRFLNIYHRENHIRCIDCFIKWFDDILMELEEFKKEIGLDFGKRNTRLSWI